jgi:hypothetical protein
MHYKVEEPLNKMKVTFFSSKFSNSKHEGDHWSKQVASSTTGTQRTLSVAKHG